MRKSTSACLATLLDWCSSHLYHCDHQLNWPHCERYPPCIKLHPSLQGLWHHPQGHHQSDFPHFPIQHHLGPHHLLERPTHWSDHPYFNTLHRTLCSPPL